VVGVHYTEGIRESMMEKLRTLKTMFRPEGGAIVLGPPRRLRCRADDHTGALHTRQRHPQRVTDHVWGWRPGRRPVLTHGLIFRSSRPSTGRRIAARRPVRAWGR